MEASANLSAGTLSAVHASLHAVHFGSTADSACARPPVRRVRDASGRKWGRREACRLVGAVARWRGGAVARRRGGVVAAAAAWWRGGGGAVASWRRRAGAVAARWRRGGGAVARWWRGRGVAARRRTIQPDIARSKEIRCACVRPRGGQVCEWRRAGGMRRGCGGERGAAGARRRRRRRRCGVDTRVREPESWRVEATGHGVGTRRSEAVFSSSLLLRGPDLEEVWLSGGPERGQRKDTRAGRRNVGRRLGH